MNPGRFATFALAVVALLSLLIGSLIVVWMRPNVAELTNFIGKRVVSLGKCAVGFCLSDLIHEVATSAALLF
jgi:hypothetical protein